MKHLHIALEVIGAIAVVYALYVFIQKQQGETKPLLKAPEPSTTEGFASGKRRVSARASALKEPDSYVEEDGDEDNED